MGLSSVLGSGRKLGTLPLLMLFDGGHYKLYSLAEKKFVSIINKGPELPVDDIKLVGSSHGWLALFNQRNNDDLYLSNPLSRRHIKLPPFHTLSCYPGINSVSKVIISGSPDEEECRAMMTVGPGDRLAFCVPGRSKEWTPIGDEYFIDYKDDYGEDEMGLKHRRRSYEDYKNRHREKNRSKAYQDFVYCSGGKFFSCTTQFKLDLRSWRPYSPIEWEDWDLRDPCSPRVRLCHDIGFLRFDGESCSWLMENKKLLQSCRHIPYLVEHYNELFIVIRFVTYYDKTVGFSVFKVVYENGYIIDLRLVEGGGSLDGLAMFVGINSHSIAMSSDDFPELKPNSIYFTDVGDPPLSISCDIGVFDYKNKTFYYPYHHLQSSTRPMWFTPSQH